MMMQKRLLGGVCGFVGLATLVMACGSKAPAKQPEAPVASNAPPPEVHEKIIPHTCAARKKLAMMLGHNEPNSSDAKSVSDDKETAPPPTSSVAPGTAKGSTAQVYRTIAPATVLIRTDNGLGTGVVVDPKGYILTNNHVVADGRKQDFVISVKVNFGDLSPTGRMIREDKTYEAVVVKTDEVRDLALIKLKEPPPANMTVAHLAKNAPQIAEKVTAVGHAGIGFLWAAKSCNVASVGERQSDTSMLSAFDCANVDPAMKQEDQEARKQRCEDVKKSMTDALAAQTQGLAIQTDCSITHGDSGGPLVNAAGEVVGLNQSIAVDAATVSFHVHLDEIRDFLSSYPENGTPVLPDPYCAGGFTPTFEDIDLDGIPETLVNKGGIGFLGMFEKLSLLMDLDEDQITKSKKEQSETFDAEVAMLVDKDTTYIWYDSDANGKWDSMLVDKESNGKPDQMYTFDEQGNPKEEKDKSKIPLNDLDIKMMKDQKSQLRLAKIANAIGGSRLISARALAEAKEATTLPDPLLGGGSTGRAFDSDFDGKADLVATRGTFSHGVLIDADESSLSGLKPGATADDYIVGKKIEAEVSIISQGSTTWAIYDLNNDAKYDIALETDYNLDPSALTATSAFKIGDNNALIPAPEHLGRKLLRPGLVPAYPRILSSMRYAAADVATDEAMGTLPDLGAPKNTRFRVHEYKGIPANSIVDAESFTSSVTLIDVDHDSKIPKDGDVQKLVADGKFDAEVAIVHRGFSRSGNDWIYYDTDNDGKFDLVLFVPTESGTPANAFKWTKPPTDPKAPKPDPKAVASLIGTGGTLDRDEASIPGKPMRYKVFKNKAIGAQWKSIASKMYKLTSVED